MDNVTAEIISAKIAKSSSKGTLSINFYLKTELDGKLVKTYADLWISDMCIERTRRALKLLDFDFDTRDLTEINKGALNGKSIEVYFKEEEYEGKKRMKCNIVTPLDSKPVIEEDILEAQARLRGKPIPEKTKSVVNDAPDDLDIPEENVPF